MHKAFFFISLTLALMFSMLPAQSAHPVLVLTTGTLVHSQKLLPEFVLEDTNNKPFTEKSLKGSWSLVFFGYTQCPDVCPVTVGAVNALFRSFPQSPAFNKLRFYFVTLDPTEDKPEPLKKYLENFNPNFVGVTGTKLEIEKLTKACNVFSYEDPNKTWGRIDHTASLFLFNPEGKLEALFSPPFKNDLILQDLKVLLRH